MHMADLFPLPAADREQMGLARLACDGCASSSSSLAHALCALHTFQPSPYAPVTQQQLPAGQQAYIIAPPLVDPDDLALAHSTFSFAPQVSRTGPGAGMMNVALPISRLRTQRPSEDGSPPATQRKAVKREPVEDDPFVYEHQFDLDDMHVIPDSRETHSHAGCQPGLRGTVMGGAAWDASEVKRMRGMMGVFRVDPFAKGFSHYTPQTQTQSQNGPQGNSKGDSGSAGGKAFQTSWQVQLQNCGSGDGSVNSDDDDEPGGPTASEASGDTTTLARGLTCPSDSQPGVGVSARSYDCSQTGRTALALPDPHHRHTHGLLPELPPGVLNGSLHGADSDLSHAPSTFAFIDFAMDPSPSSRPSTAHSSHSSSSFAPSADGDLTPTPSPASQTDRDATPTKKKVKKVKMHACSECGKEFPRPSGLQTHMNVHSGAKPYKCPVQGCTKRFGVRSNATRHLRVHQRQQAHVAAQQHAAQLTAAGVSMRQHGGGGGGGGGGGFGMAGVDWLHPGIPDIQQHPGHHSSHGSISSLSSHSHMSGTGSTSRAWGQDDLLRPTPAEALAQQQASHSSDHTSQSQQQQHSSSHSSSSQSQSQQQPWVPESLARMTNALALPLAARGPRVELGGGSNGGSNGGNGGTGSDWPYHPSQVSTGGQPHQQTASAHSQWDSLPPVLPLHSQWQKLPGPAPAQTSTRSWAWVGA